MDVCRRPMANDPGHRFVIEYSSKRTFAVRRELGRGNGETSPQRTHVPSGELKERAEVRTGVIP